MKGEIAVMGIVLCVLFAGCVQQPEDETIKIGALLPLTGEVMIWGENTKNGMELALEEINKEGINGKEIEIIYEDSQCSPSKTSTSIQKLISVDRVNVVIGEICSSATLAAAPIAESNQVVLISPGSAADSISEAGDFIFRNYPKNMQITESVIEVLDNLGRNRIAIMYVNNDYGISLKENAEKIFAGEIAIAEAHDQKATDFRTTLAKVKEQNVDAVFLATYYTDGALILKQAKELNLDVLFVGPDVFDDPEVVKIAGNAADGIIFSTVKPGAGPAFTEFSSKYKNKYNKEPGFLADFGFDALNVIAEAMRQGNFEGEEIKNFLYDLKDYPGASNTITFDSKGDVANSALVIKTIKNGEIVLYEAD